MKQSKRFKFESVFYILILVIVGGFFIYKQRNQKKIFDVVVANEVKSSTKDEAKTHFPKGITLYLSDTIALPDAREDAAGMMEISKRFKAFGLDLRIKKIEESKLAFDLPLQKDDLVVLPAPYFPKSMYAYKTLFFLDKTESGKVDKCFLNFFIIANKNNLVDKPQDIASMPMITWRKHTYTNWFFNKNNLVFDKLEEVGLKHKERLDLIRESENNKVLIELGKLLDSGKIKFRDRDPFRTISEWKKDETLNILQASDTKVPCNYLIGGNSWSLEQLVEFNEVLLKVLDESTGPQKMFLDKIIGFSHAEYARFDIDFNIRMKVFSWEVFPK